MKSFTLLLITLLLTSGCSSPQQSLPYPLELSGKGIALLTKETPFNVATINSKLLGFDLQQFTFFKTGVAHPVIRVTHNREEIMLIHPSDDKESIVSITVTSAKVTHKYGRVGTSFELFQAYQPQCEHPENEQFTCNLPSVPLLEYLFEHHILKEIIWHARPAEAS